MMMMAIKMVMIDVVTICLSTARTSTSSPAKKSTNVVTFDLKYTAYPAHGSEKKNNFFSKSPDEIFG